MTTPLWTIPLGALPSVIDLSHNNAGFDTADDFAALKAGGVRRVIHKASEGTAFVDPLYAKRRAFALAAGVEWDAYHFCTSDPETAQLAHFLAAADFDATMRGVLDAEMNRGATIAPVNAAAFAAGLDAKLGRQGVRYGNASVLEYRIALWHDGPLWWAKYGPEPTVELMHGLGIDPAMVVMWQETCSGRVAGDTAIPVDLSFDRFAGAPGVPAWPALAGFDGLAAA